VRTPAFVRFSTVAGGAGSVDTPCDVRLCRAILHEGGQLGSRRQQHPAFGHPKAIAATEGAKAPMDKAGAEKDKASPALALTSSRRLACVSGIASRK